MKKSVLYPNWDECKTKLRWFKDDMPELITKFRHLKPIEQTILIQTIKSNAEEIQFFLSSVQAFDKAERIEKLKEQFNKERRVKK